MYLEMATEEDKKMAENWKADADDILIFVRLSLLISSFTPTQWSQTGLFSAAVASLISVSIQDLRQNPQDTSNFYLANIYQTLVDPDRSNISTPLPVSPPPFSPPNYAVWVNALWFLSLVISLTCALLATLLQQWARRYLKITQPRYSLHKRARIRAFFAEGVEKCLLPWAVETLPTLLHITLFLFFAGLVVFLSNVNITIFKLVLSWVGMCTALYGCITLMPIFRHDTPYYTPLSSSAWPSVIGIAFFVSAVSAFSLYWTVYFHPRAEWLIKFARRCYRLLLQGMQKTVEEAALSLPSEIDTRAFMRTFDSLDEDHELERFFSGLPSLRRSKVVNDPLPSLTVWQKSKLRQALTGFIDRTFSSDLLPAHVKERRAMVCAKAFDPVHFRHAFSVFDKILSNYKYSGPLATEIVQIVRGWTKGEHDILDAQATISMIVSRVHPRDDSWFNLASSAMGVPEAALRNYAAHGDSLSLAILIHVVRQQFKYFLKSSWPTADFSFVLEAASKFDGRVTSTDLQLEYCTLWNQIARKAQNDNSQQIAFRILRRIHRVYLALHQDSDSAPTRLCASPYNEDDILMLWEPSSYPLCTIPGHHPDSTPHIDDDSTSTTFTCALPHDDKNIALVSSFLTSNPVATSPSTYTPLHVGEGLTDVLRPHDDISFPVQSTPDSRHIPSSSPKPVTTRAAHGSIVASRPEMNLSPPEPSASSLLPSQMPQPLHHISSPLSTLHSTVGSEKPARGEEITREGERECARR
jgi:hypothetical protein